MNQLFAYFSQSTDYLLHFSAFAVTLLLMVILRSQKARLSSRSGSTLISASLKSLYSPLMLYGLLVLVWISIDLVAHIANLSEDIFNDDVDQIVTGLFIAWFAIRTVNNYEKAAMTNNQNTRLDTTAISGLAKLARLFLILVMTIVTFDLIGLDPSGLIALGSVSGAALAFASKDLVANWFGGIMLYLDKPFKVGDWVRSPDRDIEGTVEYIGWRMTQIRTFDKRPLYVPNSLFNSITVENPSRMSHRRIKLHLGLRYDDMSQLEVLSSQIKEYLQQSPLIASDQVIIANIDRLAESSVDILVYCMTVTTDWVTYHDHKQQVILDLNKLVLENGCDFAYPTNRLIVEKIPEQES